VERVEQLSELVSGAPMSVVGIDREGLVTYVNDSLCALFGYDREELLGTHFWDYLAGGETLRVKQRFLENRDEIIPNRLDTRVNTRPGETLVIAWHNVPFYDDTGGLREVFSIGVELTALRRAQGRLARLNTTLQALSQISRLALRTTDPRSLLDRACNILVGSGVCVGVWFALSGDDGRPIGLLGSSLSNGTSPDELHAALFDLPDCITRVASSPDPVVINQISNACTGCVFVPTDRDVHGVATNVVHGDQTYATLVAHVANSQPLGEETLRLFRGIADDLGFSLAMLEARAMHRRAESALAEQSQMLDAFFENSLDPAAILDRDFNFLRVNSAYAEADEREPQDFVGENHFELYPNDENQRIFERVRDTAEPYEARAKPFEYAENPERGTTYWDWELVPITGDDGEVEMLSLWLRDVTEECVAQQELRQNQESLRELTTELAMAEQRERREIAGVLHDNVAQILAFAKMKLGTVMDAGDAEVKEDLQEVLRYVNDAIWETRTLTSQLAPPVLEQFGFTEAVEWLADDLGDQHDIAIHFDTTAQLEPLDEKTSITLFQATRELIVNAIKHSGAGQVNILGTVKDHMIHIEVEDDGVGFDPGVLDQQNSSGEGRFGLLNIRERIAYLGGETIIESEPGVGTKVRIVCPMNDVEGADEDERRARR
jgi:PAS domain S-box-containing protein